MKCSLLEKITAPDKVYAGYVEQMVFIKGNIFCGGFN